MPGFAAVRADAGWEHAVAAAVTAIGARVQQSVLEPAGPAAEQIAGLWWVMCVAFAAVYLLVLILLVAALYRRPAAADSSGGPPADASTPPLGRSGFIIAGGIVLPIVVLTPILFLSLETSAELRQPHDALTIRVVGHMWWWEVSYPESGIVTANELCIPVGEKVRHGRRAPDVVHSFWVPSLNGKRDMIPGIRNEFWLQADEPGVYRGQCAEYCGVQHANMILHVIALPSEDFAAWVEERAVPSPPANEVAEGERLFLARGCGTCHTVRGAAAVGVTGPDLTHFGSRQTIAGVAPNTRGNLAGWIADPHGIKPGVRMPRTYLAPDELLALVRYLESLQ